MKLPSLALTAAVVLAAAASPGAVSAVDCTEKQLEAWSSSNSSSVQKACPSLFAEGKDAIDPTKLAALTTEALKALAPCKESACVTELTKFVDAAPDCLVVGLSIKGTYSASLKLCEAFKDGTVTVAKATEIFGDVIKNASNTFASIFGGGSSEGMATVAPPPSNSASNPGAAGSPAATTAAPAATKSAASLTTVSGLAALVATTVAASLFV